jgi:hypothetical protein
MGVLVLRAFNVAARSVDNNPVTPGGPSGLLGWITRLPIVSGSSRWQPSSPAKTGGDATGAPAADASMSRGSMG